MVNLGCTISRPEDNVVIASVLFAVEEGPHASLSDFFSDPTLEIVHNAHRIPASAIFIASAPLIN